MQTIIGKKELIEIERVAAMLRGFAPRTIDRTQFDWRTTAALAINAAISGIAKRSGSIGSAEDIWQMIFDRWMDGRLRLIRA